LGRTFSHAIESAMNYKYKHGGCVALGILEACYISEKMGLCKPSLTEQIKNLLKRMGILQALNDCNEEKVYHFYYTTKG
jgi:3-dehydroquinate synthase